MSTTALSVGSYWSYTWENFCVWHKLWDLQISSHQSAQGHIDLNAVNAKYVYEISQLAWQLLFEKSFADIFSPFSACHYMWFTIWGSVRWSLGNVLPLWHALLNCDIYSWQHSWLVPIYLLYERIGNQRWKFAFPFAYSLIYLENKPIDAYITNELA